MLYMLVGLAQLGLDKKFEKAVKIIQMSKADIVVFPELFNTGYDLESIKSSNPKPIFEASKKSKALIIAGMPENNYNVAFVIHRGKIIGKHRKTKLFPLLEEEKIFKAGRIVKPIKTPFGLIGLMICYELRFPEIARKLVMKGAKILFVIARFPLERIDHWRTLIRARAIENQVFVVGVNSEGHSTVVDPLGKISVEFGVGERYDEVEIDTRYVDDVRVRYPFLNYCSK